MELDWKVLVIIGLTAIVAFGTVMLTQEEFSPLSPVSFPESWFSGRSEEMPATKAPEGNLPPATGDIDDIAGILLLEPDDETAMIQDSDNDAAALTADSEEISNLEQFYDENDI